MNRKEALKELQAGNKVCAEIYYALCVYSFNKNGELEVMNTESGEIRKVDGFSSNHDYFEKYD